jgi:Spy/CpxP family protein refolding chaperone
MKVSILFAPILLAASLTTASLAAAQQSPPAPEGEHGMPGQGPQPGPGHDHEHEHAGPEHGMHQRLMLTEAQQDKLFALRHAAEPAEREHEKAEHHAQEALRELSDSGHFDEAKAAALAQALGQAVAAETLDRARAQAQFFSVLTPEQRAAMQKEKTQHGPGEHGPGKQP